MRTPSNPRQAALPAARCAPRSPPIERAGRSRPGGGSARVEALPIQVPRGACGVGLVADLRGEHRALPLALSALARLEHRGGLGADAQTGDGSGILLALPRAFLWGQLRRLEGAGGRSASFGDTPPEGFACGQLFLPPEPSARHEARSLVRREARARGFWLLGWRRVPTDPSRLGRLARSTMPSLEQALLVARKRITLGEEERRLGALGRAIEREARAAGLGGVVVASLSTRTIVYKGLVRGRELGAFFLDLRREEVSSDVALFHERFSTNTQPTWALAQPLGRLAHNGEINTIGGNRRWLVARERELRRLARERGELDRANDARLFDRAGSDSKTLDELTARLVETGYSLDEAVLALVPAAVEGRDLPGSVESFYRYHARRFEPFDGPAAVVFTDGRRAGACLDRNGLRPARFSETDNGLFVLASEAGVLELDPARILRAGRLGPGQAVVVELEDGRVLFDRQLKRLLSVARPYGAWLRGSLRPRPWSSRPAPRPWPAARLGQRRLAAGLTDEELERVVWPMARDGKQPVGSMGNDAPLAALSVFPRPLAHYFSQRFAQVTNPPIDPHREREVMSLRTILGPRAPLLDPPGPLPGHLEVDHPIFDRRMMRSLDELRTPPLVVERLDATYAVATGATGLSQSLDRLAERAVDAVEQGRTLLVASDRGLSPERAPIPSVLVAGTIHEALVEAGLRHRGTIVVEAGDVWDAHGLALCLGVGASAVAPHVGFEAVRQEAARPEGALREVAYAGGWRGPSGERRGAQDPAVRAVLAYQKALADGLLQIMAKMGISTLAGYRGARLFEAVGIESAVVDRCLPGIPSRIGGIGFAEIADDIRRRHQDAFGPADVATPATAPKGLHGFYRYRRAGEQHAVTPDVMRALQAACRTGDRDAYRRFSALLRDHPPVHLRDLLRLRTGEEPAPEAAVDPASSIRRRFCGAAMSIGALSLEAHETLALALNRIGGRSSSGEGGEDPERFGTDRESRIKQVASGRFGVTAHYLVRAEEIEIKMAQGSKPGEGGHLPGAKVTVEIARLRHAMPGVTLISPPPHHDIYSIEDLAQLIFDLKQVAPRARIVVKLVSEHGVGTVACGVAKAFADVILISGADGGTGASPLGSIKYAGLPWELGLAETQQALVRAGLRGRVTLRTDGGLRTGRDVVIAALLGAEEFCFGTMPLVAAGCVMQRRCHLNTCSVGVATQREDLRRRFRGEPEHVVRYFTFVADEVREHLAALGLTRLDDAVGRTDLLEERARPTRPRASLLDLGAVLAPSAGPTEGTSEPQAACRAVVLRNDPPPRRARTLDHELESAMDAALDGDGRFEASRTVQNVHRAVGTRLGGRLLDRLVREGLAQGLSPRALARRLDRVPPGTVRLRLTGTAGQSLGAFLPRGVQLELEGAANDYVGKGLSGGEVSIRPPRAARELVSQSHRHAIVGNTVLYGATSGALFAAGRAGERFCVRNSGALAVCEGVGDHGCEYMTGGVAVVLGRIGYNFAAGMTGGVAFCLDEDGDARARVNRELVEVRPVDPRFDAALLQELLRRHQERTGSARAAALLGAWDEALARFIKVVPRGAAGDPLVQRAATVGLFQE